MGDSGEGTQFELEIKGFGKVLQELREFELNNKSVAYLTSKCLREGTDSFSQPKATGRA